MSFLENLFKRLSGQETQKSVIDQKSVDNWEEYRTNGGLTGHRISLANMSDKQIEQLKQDLSNLDIKFDEKVASKSTHLVAEGDPTIRVTDPMSVAKLRVDFFGYPDSNPVERWFDEDSNGHTIPYEKKVFRCPALPLQAQDEEKTPVSTSESAETLKDRVNWKANYINWDKIQGGYRINVSDDEFSRKERTFLKSDLESKGIHFEERYATVKTDRVNVGDLTLRVLDPESVQRLETMYFNIDSEPTMTINDTENVKKAATLKRRSGTER